MCSSDQEHAEGLSHDAVEQVEGRVSCHHEEVRQEEELPAAVVQEGVVLAAEQRLVRVLGRQRPQVMCVCVIPCLLLGMQGCAQVWAFVAQATAICPDWLICPSGYKPIISKVKSN